jgi:putative ABC transport system ATP-binding protein
MNIVETDNVYIEFGERIIFERMELSAVQGDRIMLEGDVGSGKSILMKTVSGLHIPTRGRVLYHGRPFHYFLEKRFFDERKAICYLLEGVEPLANLSALENMALYYRANTELSDEEIQSVVKNRLSELNLAEKLNLRPSLLSMEERVILNFLMNLKENCELFIVDEIFTFLNEEVKEKLKKILAKELSRENITMILGKADAEFLGIRVNKRWKIQKGIVRQEAL